MEIFHYVSDVLRHTPLFDCMKGDSETNTGAIYNDFDFDPSLLLLEHDFNFQYSQTTNAQPISLGTRPTVPEHAINYAIIQADDHTGACYAALSFDHDLYDIVNEVSSDIYMETVYKILSGGWREIAPMISEEALRIYERRKSLNWEGKDSFYDMWLFATHCIRPSFPIRDFSKKIFRLANPSNCCCCNAHVLILHVPSAFDWLTF